MKRHRKSRALRVIFPLVLLIAVGDALPAGAEAPQWERGDPHKMHWAQTPDEGFTGAAVSFSQARLADSFKCTTPGPVRSIHLWGSFRNDVLPAKGPGGLTLEIGIFSDEAGEDGVSRPGQLLWSQKFSPGEYSACKVHDGPEDWYEPGSDLYLPANHRSTFQYDFSVEPEAIWLEAGRVYWLAAMNASVGVIGEFGWKTTARQYRWDGDAAYLQCDCDGWIEMAYPADHLYGPESLDLAFVVSSGIEPAPQYDLGDAPDSSNNVPGAEMTVYSGDVTANFPTVHEAPFAPFGPLHRRPRERFFLGRWVSLEVQADIGVDEDAVTNVAPRHDVANRDGGDDGLRLPVVMPANEATTLCYRVTAAECRERQAYVNVWCDWNRDGDWNDSLGDRDTGGEIPEWAVQNQPITLSDAGTFTFYTPSFPCWHPDPDAIGPMWLRMTIAELPWRPEEVDFVGGAGPEEGYAYGETEDYLVQPVARATHAQCDWGDASVPPLLRGQLAAATVEVRGGGAVVLAWIDFDADGELEADEMIHDRFLPDGVHVLRFRVPVFAALGETVARFHISRHGVIEPGEGACDAEIEDHEVRIDRAPAELKMWCQLPDLTPHNVDVRASSGDGQFRMVADDFECTCPGLLQHVRLWGAWKNGCPGQIKKIRLSIHPDDPAGAEGPDRANPYAKPGPEVLWQQEVSAGRFEMALYYEAQVARAWWRDPESGETLEGEDGRVWQIDINVPSEGAFLQEGTREAPRIYWLAVQVEATGGQFGWTSRHWPEHSLADAVWDAHATTPRTWRELYYPLCHPYYDLERNSVDMAFCLLFRPQGVPEKPTSQPMTITHCPAVETMCPSLETWCPAMATRCPAAATQCPAHITECPTIATVCPTGETQCPASATQCPVVLTTCPISLTQCHSMQTFCPPVETQCPASITYCPPMQTLCPAGQTGCGVCPPPCPPPCPPCAASTNGAAEAMIVSLCPAVEAQCLTVGEFPAVPRASQPW